MRLAGAIVLFAASWGPVRNTTAPVARTYDLGCTHGVRTMAVVLTRAQPGAHWVDVSVRLTARTSGGTERGFTVPVGAGYPKRLKVTAADFAGLGRKQLFISAEAGGVRSFLLDCDGGRVRKLYARDNGRVWVDAERDRHGRWSLVEDWPRIQWETRKGLGRGEEIGGNVVRRRLRWDGSAFVPEHPGPTRPARGNRRFSFAPTRP